MTDKADWQGRVGQEWARRADALDQLLGPVGDAGLDALGPVSGIRVLDIGCGAGATSRALSQRGAVVTGIDLSADLLAEARARDPDRRSEYLLDDASSVSFADPFDRMFSRFGTMFFDDPVAAFSHLHGLMRDDGKAVFVAWVPREENPWASLPLDAAAHLIDVPAADAVSAGPGPFAWCDPDTFNTILSDAGWRDVTWHAETHMAMMGAGDDADPLARAAEFALRIGPLASRLRGATPDLRTAVRGALINAFSPWLKDGAVQIPTSAWIIQARA